MEDSQKTKAQLVREIESLRRSVPGLNGTRPSEADNEFASRTEEGQFQQLLDDLPIGVMVHGPDEEILHINPAARDLLGFPEGKFYVKSPCDSGWDMVREDGTEFPAEQHPVHQAVITQKKIRNVVMGIRIPGKPDLKWLLVCADPHFASDGAIHQVVCTFSDITEQRQLTETLTLRDRAIAAASTGIIIVDPNNKENFIRYANPAFERITGYSADELGRSDFNLLHGPETDPQELRRIHNAIVDGQPYQGVIRNYRKDGTPFWNELTISPVRDASGKLTHHIQVQTDITERRQAEQRLQESEALYRAVVEGVSEALFMMEPEPDGEFRCVFVNPSYLKITGLKIDQIVGKRVGEIVSPEEAKIILGRYHDTVASGVTNEYEETLEMPVGRVSMLTRLVPIVNERGECIRLVGAANDITLRKQAERTLRKTNKRLFNVLESTNDAFFSLDRDWHFTYINPKAEQIGGRPRAQLIGKNIWDVYPHIAGTLAYQEYHRAVAKQVSVDFEDYYPNRDMWLHIHAHPSQDGLSVYMQDISDRKRVEQQLKQSIDKLQRTLEEIARAMAYAVEIRDPYTAGHQRRVSVLACAMAREMSLSEDQVELIRIAGLLHDIGKISIPAEILSKPIRLSGAELSIIRTHAQVGYEILKGIEFPPPVALVALQHHERIDGTGYPAGLAGDEIILESRIMAVADVVEAMASHRPYRPSLGIERALEEVLQHKETRYDSVAVEACMNVFTKNGFDFEQLMRADEA